MTSPDDTPMLRRLPTGAIVPLGSVAWEPHPDGRGGVRPIIPTARGTIEMLCPECGAPLIREGAEMLIRTSSFACQRCHARFAGTEAALAARPP